MARFIRFPWATTGDRVAIPFDTDPGGDVSYSQGFGPDFEIAPGDPGWKPVPRDGTNGYLYDITDNIRQYQVTGTPDWHPAADNGGVAISYPINARVYHADKVWRSIVLNNTVEPGTDPTKWVEDPAWGQATTSLFGVVRYATNPEVLAKTATDRAVNPAGLGALFDTLLNMPVYPEVLTTDGLFTLSNPAGNVRIAAGTSWVLRGAFTYTSVQTDLPTLASKTYHLRWDRTNGFVLYDLANGTYNPGAVPETDPVFDTTYDNMLVARVVTSAGNVATITPLVNKNRLYAAYLQSLNATRTTNGSGLWAMLFPLADIQWSRTPSTTGAASRWSYLNTLPAAPEEPAVYLNGLVTDGTGTLTAETNRYKISPIVAIDVNQSAASFTFGVQMSLTASA